MGGGDEETNIVLLTAREHFLAHWLLWRHFRNRQTASMFNAMTRTGKGQKRITRGRGYAEAKEAGQFAQRGKKLSEETKAKIKQNNARTGKPNWNSGKTFKKKKVECSRCGEYSSTDHNRRWHEDNCQLGKYKNLLSTLSRKEICLQENISNAKLQYWINKIKKL